MAYQVECVVIGAGVVGLATARQLALAGLEVLVLEQHEHFGSETSSRNSEVIHAGIYYPKNSLKAALCVAGKQALYEYCESRQVPFKPYGKLIVASSAAQLAKLKAIRAAGEANGLTDLALLNASQVAELEPDLHACAALYSPSTGVIDSHQYMLQLLADLEVAGGQMLPNAAVASLSFSQSGTRLLTADNTELDAKYCVNASGLYAHELLLASNYPSNKLPSLNFAKGDYFSYQAKVPFSHLIYPVPQEGGLGIHLTLDMTGAARFGPDVTWLPKTRPQAIDYRVDADKAESFVKAVQAYWPALRQDRLVADYSGVRPKLAAKGQGFADFLIAGEGAHGQKGFVNLMGIESPGLTASLAIGAYVKDILLNSKR